MVSPAPLKHWSTAIVGITLLAVVSSAQEPAPPTPPLPDSPRDFNSSGQRFRVVPIKGFSYPWAIVFLPDGTALLNERGARTLRIVRGGVLDPKPVAGLPLMIKPSDSRAVVDLALHPRFAEN